MARSSITSRFRIDGVSRLPRRSRSARTLDTIPDELTQQTPPRSTAAGRSHPSSSPAAKPGRKLATASNSPGCRPVRRPCRSSSPLYSRPERQEQQQHTDLGDERDELGADVERREAALTDGQAGEQVEGDGRDAEPAGDPSQDGQRECDRADLDEGQRRVGARGRDDHEASRVRSCDSPSGVPTATTTSPASSLVSGSGRRDRRAAADDGDDRRARLGAEPPVGDGRAVEARTDGRPVDGQPLDLLLHGDQCLADLAGAEELGERSGVVGAQMQDGRARVGVGTVVDGELPAAVAMGQDRNALAARRRELVPHAHARQQGLSNFGHRPNARWLGERQSGRSGTEGWW